MFKHNLLLVALLFATVSGFYMNNDYRAPVCGSMQTCSQRSLNGSGPSFPNLRMCTCPEGTQCSEEYSIDVKHTRYSFCQPVELLPCVNSEISIIVRGLQSHIRCICPNNAELKQMHYMVKNEEGRLPDVYFECVRMA